MAETEELMKEHGGKIPLNNKTGGLYLRLKCGKMNDGGGSALSVVAYQGRGSVVIFLLGESCLFPSCSVSDRAPKNKLPDLFMW